MRKSHFFRSVVGVAQVLLAGWLLPLPAQAGGPGRTLPKYSRFAPIVANQTWLAKASATLKEINLPTAAMSKRWLGTVSSDWNTAANWSAGVPVAADEVVIPAGVPYYPVVADGTARANGLSIAPGSALTLLGGVLEVAGNFTNHGVVFAKGGTVALTGPARQTIGGSSSSAFYSLTVGGQGAELAAPVAVQRILTLQGNLATAGQRFTLLSNTGTPATVVNEGGMLVTPPATLSHSVSTQH